MRSTASTVAPEGGGQSCHSSIRKLTAQVVRGGGVRAIRRAVGYDGQTRGRRGVLHRQLRSSPQPDWLLSTCVDAFGALGALGAIFRPERRRHVVPARRLFPRCNQSHISGAYFVTFVASRRPWAGAGDRGLVPAAVGWCRRLWASPGGFGRAPAAMGWCRRFWGERRARGLRSRSGNLKKDVQTDCIEVHPKSRFAHRFGDFGYISLGRESRAGGFRYTLQTRAIGATVSAGALHAQGWGFESLIAHHVMLTRGLHGPSRFLHAGFDLSAGFG